MGFLAACQRLTGVESDTSDWFNPLTVFLTSGSFQGLIGPSLIGPDRRSGSTKSETWNATYVEGLNWAVTMFRFGGFQLKSELPALTAGGRCRHATLGYRSPIDDEQPFPFGP